MLQNIKKASLKVIYASLLFSAPLSAWYDPSGYWGYHHPNACAIPSQGEFTVRAELMTLLPHVNNLSINEDTFRNYILNNPVPTTVFFTNNERDRHFKWKPAFKLGVGYDCKGCWEVDINWTHYGSRAHISDIQEVETRWKMNIDMIDVEVGKELWFNRCLRFKPFAGIRVARLYQRYDFNLPGILLQPLDVIPFGFTGKLKYKYLGGGPRLGFDSQLNVGCGFNIYAKASANWLWGLQQDRYRDDIIFKEYDKDRNGEGLGITNFGVGLGWSDLWHNARRRLTFRIGYENYMFFHGKGFNLDGAVVSKDKKYWYAQGVSGTITLDF